MRPEQRAAARLRDRLGLEPPVDVESVIEHFAEVEKDDLPANCDAIVLRSGHSRPKPLVLIDRRRPFRRRRFTLAHELGHLVIPWHLGTVACHTDGYWILGDQLYRVTEAEANRFASEFLLPSTWLREAIADSGSLRELMGTLSVAKVSPLATAFALVPSLPPGYLFVMVDGHGIIRRHAASDGTAIHYPREGRFDVSQYRGMAADHHRSKSGSDDLHWFQFESTRALPPVDSETDSRILLREILAEVHAEEADRAKASRTINGVIGAANSMYEVRTAEQLYALCEQRFAARPSPVAECAKHPDFPAFLARRAAEVVQRRQ